MSKLAFSTLKPTCAAVRPKWRSQIKVTFFEQALPLSTRRNKIVLIKNDKRCSNELVIRKATVKMRLWPWFINKQFELEPRVSKCVTTAKCV